MEHITPIEQHNALRQDQLLETAAMWYNKYNGCEIYITLTEVTILLPDQKQGLQEDEIHDSQYLTRLKF